MTVSNGQVRQLELPKLPSAVPEAQACPRARAREAPPAPPVTLRKPQAGAPRVAAQRLAGVLAGDSLLHAAPPSLHQARRDHHATAARWGLPVIRWGRLAWGYLHLLIRLPLFAADWALATPARFALTAAVVTVVWFCH